MAEGGRDGQKEGRTEGGTDGGTVGGRSRRRRGSSREREEGETAASNQSIDQSGAIIGGPEPLVGQVGDKIDQSIERLIDNMAGREEEEGEQQGAEPTVRNK